MAVQHFLLRFYVRYSDKCHWFKLFFFSKKYGKYSKKLFCLNSFSFEQKYCFLFVLVSDTRYSHIHHFCNYLLLFIFKVFYFCYKNKFCKMNVMGKKKKTEAKLRKRMRWEKRRIRKYWKKKRFVEPARTRFHG